MGDVSWHHGWLLHCSPPQSENSPARVALAVSYFADGARTRKTGWTEDECMLEDQESYAGWFGAGPGKVRAGSVARHELLPIVCSE
jgi:hypothetical protein